VLELSCGASHYWPLATSSSSSPLKSASKEGIEVIHLLLFAPFWLKKIRLFAGPDFESTAISGPADPLDEIAPRGGRYYMRYAAGGLLSHTHHNSPKTRS
jgi:hypothetical protein